MRHELAVVCVRVCMSVFSYYTYIIAFECTLVYGETKYNSVWRLQEACPLWPCENRTAVYFFNVDILN